MKEKEKAEHREKIRKIRASETSTQKEWHELSCGEALARLSAKREGLSAQEARERLEKYGENVLREGKKKSTLQVFFAQFADLLVLILIAAAVISMLSGNMESAIVIFAVLLLNAVLGTVQYEKAQKSLESLKSLSAPHVKVLRDGKKAEILSKDVVPGDAVLLEAGDMVAADGRILNSYSLQVNESSLTGESANVDKTEETLEGGAALADRINMVYSGSLVTGGRALVLVTGTGMQTEIGRIAELMNATKEKKTPLQVSLDNFSSRLAVLILIVCAGVFALNMYRQMPLLDSLMFAVALAVAAIPEALSSIVTIVQAMGTREMAREQAIIKELKAVESLGCVSVICSDKTGTLTQNKMTVQKVYVGGETLRPSGLDLKNQLHRYLLYDAILTNDSSIVDGNGIGDPTEYALLEMVRKIDVQDEILREIMPRLEELPFDSERKLMSTKYELHGVPTVLTKGAPDVILERTVNICTGSEIRPITEQDREAILQKNREFSENGLRVLAFACKEPEAKERLTYENERDYTFLGLISMADPPREESKAAVADARRAGIRTVMITGDHKITAAAIAKQIGIFEEGDLALTGTELDALTEEELDRDIAHISVYARVSPENKIRIVEAWQRSGNIVAMTGDGVNDAPALKKADVGVAMGITGTEVARDAASMILSDDNFATIIKAVTNGRCVYRNIRNAVQFLLSGNTAGILSVLYTSAAGLPVPFAPVHLLFINLLTDSLPAIAIGMESGDADLIAQKPRDPKEGILTKAFLMTLLIQGGLIAVCTLAAFSMGLRAETAAAAVSGAGVGGKTAAVASTMAFATLTLARLFHGFNCRNARSLFCIGFSGNRYSLLAFLVGVVLLALVLFVPIVRRLFSVAVLTGGQLGAVCLLALTPTALIQLGKLAAGFNFCSRI